MQISMPRYLIYALLLFSLSRCGSADSKQASSETKSAVETPSGDKQLNINILWDLSDRIDNKKNPSSPPHYERDIEIIRSLTEIFKRDMQKRGAYKAKSKIRVFFTPPPANDKINSIAKNLSYDLSAYTGEQANKNKKEVYDSITPKFANNANQIYQLTLQDNKSNQWDGADIWRFFKNNVKDYCIDKSKVYRNILVIITDGYIYHKDSREKQGNRSAYVLPETLKPFRNNMHWKQLFDKGDYGLISTRKDLQDLEVLALEITPSNDHKNDEDILKEYLGKWFTDMGIGADHFACYNTDLPEYTRKKIEEFMIR
jgi:hypothetical protein